MLSRRLVLSFAVCAALGAVALTSGCLFSPTPCKPGDPCDKAPAFYRPLTTPVAPLWNLGVAYRFHTDQEAIDQYKTIFDPDRYVFQWRQDPSLPPQYYGYGDEIQSTTNLFSDKDVETLDLTFLQNAQADTANWGVPSDIEGHPAGTRKFSITQITLHYKKSSEEYLANGVCEFYVAPVDTVAGVAQWKIIFWNDLTGSSVAAPFARAKETAPAPTGSALLQAAALADRIKN